MSDVPDSDARILSVELQAELIRQALDHLDKAASLAAQIPERESAYEAAGLGPVALLGAGALPDIPPEAAEVARLAWVGQCVRVMLTEGNHGGRLGIVRRYRDASAETWHAWLLADLVESLNRWTEERSDALTDLLGHIGESFTVLPSFPE